MGNGKKRLGCVGCAGICLLTLLGIAALAMILGPQRPAIEREPGAIRPPESPSSDAASPAKFIAGIAPVDVYLNLEKKGFKIQKLLNTDFSEFRCTDETEAFDLSATAMGTASQVAVVSASVVNKKPAAFKTSAKSVDFLGYVASLPYAGSEPQAARDWVEQHVGQSAETVIGGVRLTLSGTEYAHTLRMAPE